MAAYADARALPHTLPAIRAAVLGCGASFEFIVALTDAGDGSRDLIERGLAGLPLRIVDVPPGKFGALRTAAAEARGEVLVLLDADARPSPDAVALVARPVLAGTSDVVVPRRTFATASRGLPARWSHLWHLAVHRLRQSDTGFLYRLSGELFAMPRALFPASVGAPVVDDAAIGSLLQQNGARFCYQPAAQTEVVPPDSLRDWFRQKLRTRRGMVQLRRSDPTVWRFQRKLVLLVLRGEGSLPLRVSFALQEVGLWVAAWLMERFAGPAGASWAPIASTKRWGSDIR